MRTLKGQNIPNLDEGASLTDFPYGRAKNSYPPSSRNGTPIWEENLLTDEKYAILAVMKAAGIVPDENAENINQSQFLEALDLLYSSGQFEVVVITEDIVAEATKIYFVDTTAAVSDVVVTIPDADDNKFQTRIYKVSGISTPDVLVRTVSGIQEIGGLATQTINGLSEGIYVVERTNTYEIIQDNRSKVSDKLSRSSGILSGFDITVASPTTINISAGLYTIEDATDPGDPISKVLKFDGVDGLLVGGLSIFGRTEILINSSGVLTQKVNSKPTEVEVRNKPRIAIVIHIFGDGTIEEALPWWTVAQNPSSRITSFMNFLGLVKNGLTISANGANLQIDSAAGEISAPGIVADDNPLKPDSRQYLTQSPVVSILYLTQTTSDRLDTEIDVTNYNPTNSTISAIPLPGATSVIHRVYYGVNGLVVVQYGQATYGTLQLALTALIEGADPFIENHILSGVAILAGYIIASRDATDLSNSAEATFIGTGKFGDLAGGATATQLATLQKAYDNSVQPEIITDDARLGLTVRRGSSSADDPIFEVQDDSGTNIIDVDESGLKVRKKLEFSLFDPRWDTSLFQNFISNGQSLVQGWDGVAYSLIHGLYWDGSTFRSIGGFPSSKVDFLSGAIVAKGFNPTSDGDPVNLSTDALGELIVDLVSAYLEFKGSIIVGSRLSGSPVHGEIRHSSTYSMEMYGVGNLLLYPEPGYEGFHFTNIGPLGLITKSSGIEILNIVESKLFIKNVIDADSDEAAFNGVIIVSDRASGVRQDGEIFYEAGALKGMESSEIVNLASYFIKSPNQPGVYGGLFTTRTGIAIGPNDMSSEWDLPLVFVYEVGFDYLSMSALGGASGVRVCYACYVEDVAGMGSFDIQRTSGVREPSMMNARSNMVWLAAAKAGGARNDVIAWDVEFTVENIGILRAIGAALLLDDTNAEIQNAANDRHIYKDAGGDILVYDDSDANSDFILTAVKEDGVTGRRFFENSLIGLQYSPLKPWRVTGVITGFTEFFAMSGGGSNVGVGCYYDGANWRRSEANLDAVIMRVNGVTKELEFLTSEGSGEAEDAVVTFVETFNVSTTDVKHNGSSIIGGVGGLKQEFVWTKAASFFGGNIPAYGMSIGTNDQIGTTVACNVSQVVIGAGLTTGGIFVVTRKNDAGVTQQTATVNVGAIDSTSEIFALNLTLNLAIGDTLDVGLANTATDIYIKAIGV